MGDRSAQTGSTEPLRLAMVAGETSGDLLGSRVIRALREGLGARELILEGIGGAHMQAEGLSSLYPMERLAVMGLVEPLGRLPELLRERSRLAGHWIEQPPDLFIGVDAPDFNLGLARTLRDSGVPTAQLVSPTVWAWRPGRVHKVARAVDSVLCLFPFEPPLYGGVSVRARYVGHPLVEELAGVADRRSVRQDLNIDPEAQVIALLPGSRSSEVAQLGAEFLRAGQLLQSRDERRTLIMPAAGSERFRQCQTLLRELGMESRVTLTEGGSRETMIAADVVCLASGTASFEAMLLQRPMVIAYRMAPLSWALTRRMAVTRFAGLPNILADREVVPELLQEALSAPALALAMETQLLEGGLQVDALADVRKTLVQDFDEALVAAVQELLEAVHHVP